MGYKKITIARISELAGVSPTTASMILSGRQGVSFSRETIERVMLVARENGYLPSRHHNHCKNDVRTVLIACPNISNPYYARIVQAIEQEAHANNYRTLIVNHYRDADKEAETVTLARQIGVCGIIFATMPACTELLVHLKESIPVVILGDRDTRVELDTVEINDYGAGCLIGAHLTSLGHKNLAFITTTLAEQFTMRQRRLTGLRDTIEKKCPNGHIEVLCHNVTPEEELSDIDIEYHIGYLLATECLEQYPEVTGMVAINDSVAAGVIDAIRAKGRRIPEDLSVCGFDNIGTSRCEFVSLTSVDHQLEEKGRYAFHIIHKRITGMNPHTITRVEYPTRLIVRHSTGRARS